MTDPRPAPVLQISDQALASLAAHVAATTPGVARLHPPLARVITHVATRILRHPRTTPDANTAAVTIEPPGTTDEPTIVRVRIVATGQPSVVTTATTVQQRIGDELRRITGLPSDVRVLVTAYDPPYNQL